MTFSQVLESILQELDCTAKELALASGLDASVISRYRSGERVPAVDSVSFDRLCTGLAQLAVEKGREAVTPEGLRERLLEVLPHSDIPLEPALEKLRRLLKAAGVSQRAVAAALHFDSSTVYRIFSGERTPRDVEEFFRTAVELAAEAGNLAELCELTGLEPEALSRPGERVAVLYRWVTSAALTPAPQPIHGFLKNLDSFDLNEYIRAIHFDTMKVPTVPFQLPVSHTATGLKDMMDTELNFLKATVLSRSTHPVLIYSDMPMEKMAQDPDFPKKWMMGMAAMLKKGLHLNLIHNLNRPFSELMLGLESYIPMYMTGQISPYYLDYPPDRVFHHLLEVSGAAALRGQALVGHHAQGEYTLTKNREEVRRYQQWAEQLLAKASPLMEIYPRERKTSLHAFLTRESQVSRPLHAVLSTPPLCVISPQLLDRILEKNRVPAEDRKQIRDFAEFQQRLMKTRPDGKPALTVELSALSREAFEEAPPALSLSEMFYERDVLYDWEDYQDHLALLEQAAREERLRLLPGDRAVFRNIQILLRPGAWAMVSKSRSPAIHFVLRHPKLVDAMERFTPPVVEEPPTSPPR